MKNIRLTALILSVLMLFYALTGCADGASSNNEENDKGNNDYDNNYNNDNNNDNDNDNDYDGNYGDDDFSYGDNSDSFDEGNEELPMPEDANWDEEMQAVLNTKVEFGSRKLNELMDRANQVGVEYPGEELYGIIKAYKQYSDLPEYKSIHENYFADGKLSLERFISIVKENNDNSGYKSDRFMSDEDLETVCEIVLSVLNDYAANATEGECRFLSEKISNLKVLKFQDFANGYYDAIKGELGIDMSRYKNNYKGLKATVCHETYHIIQGGTPAEFAKNGIYYRAGFTCQFEEDEERSPLNLNSICEASAEILAQSFNNSYKYDVYESIIRFINLFRVAAIASEDIDEATFPKLTLQSGWEDVFEYFGCTSQAEKEEILNMLCVVNYFFNLQLDFNYFYDEYEEKYGVHLSNTALRTLFYDSMGTTLTKVFYRNLAEALQNKTLTVDEVFIINALFEYRMADILLIEQATNLRNTLLLYRELQHMLFEIVSDESGIAVETLISAYDNYYKNAPLNTYSVSIFSESEAEFLYSTVVGNYNSRYRSFNETVEKYLKD